MHPVKDGEFTATGAILRQGRPGKRLIIGKGAVVTRDVPPGVKVVGKSAKTLIKD